MGAEEDFARVVVFARVAGADFALVVVLGLRPLEVELVFVGDAPFDSTASTGKSSEAELALGLRPRFVVVVELVFLSLAA